MNHLAPQNYAEIERLATAFAASGLFKDARTMGQALVKMMAGAEFGIGPFAAMTGIFIVDGKPSMAAVTIAGCIKKSAPRYDYKIVAHDDKHCSIDFYENGEKVGNSTFSMSDAAQAGLTSNPTYKKYPRNMTFSRAMTNGARWYASQVFGGAVYTPDEINQGIALDAEGAPTNLPGAPEPIEQQQEPPRKPLDNTQLVALYDQAFPGTKVKLGAWIEAEGIATDLKARGRAGMTPDEKFEVERRLRDAINATPSPVELSAEREIMSAAVIDAPVSATAEQAPAPEAVGISSGQHMRIMAMFNGCGMAEDDARHAFAINVLGDKKKASSKSWTQDDYTKISKALEEHPV